MISIILANTIFATLSLTSPDGRLGAQIDANGVKVYFDGKQVVAVNGVRVSAGEVEYLSGDSIWENRFGERRHVRDLYNGARTKEVEFRLYNEGLAWRPSSNRDQGEYVFDFEVDARCWPVSHAQGEYKPLRLSELGLQKPIPGWAPVAAGVGRMYNYCQDYIVEGSCESPLVVELDQNVVAIGDAGVYGTARMRFKNPKLHGKVASYLEGPREGDKPSWKYIRVAATPAALYNGNDLLLNLSDECALDDVSYVKPGKVMRLAKLDTGVAKELVDFIKKNGIDYMEIDCGWYGNEHTGNPLEPGLAPDKIARGDKFDFFEILAYARKREIPVILYVNRLPLQRNYEAILDTLKKWGVSGVKYGFLAVGSSMAREESFKFIKAAAERGLMVDIHDEMRYTGEQRTYPNMMTVEGIGGNEEMPDAAHNSALVFTRFLCGPADYTPCWNVNRVKNTFAHQLAMAATYFSPWQFLYWYSQPKDVPADPALEFWKRIPTVFDETIALDGKIGEFAVIARRKDADWFVGGLNGLSRRDFVLSTAFLSGGEWDITLFTDKDVDITSGLGAVAVSKRRIKAGETISIPAAARGGFAAIASPAKVRND